VFRCTSKRRIFAGQVKAPSGCQVTAEGGKVVEDEIGGVA
jgi:hypothetical protein